MPDQHEACSLLLLKHGRTMKLIKQVRHKEVKSLLQLHLRQRERSQIAQKTTGKRFDY